MLGHLITVEGIHGAGKTGLARALVAHFDAPEHRFVYAQDQSATTLGRAIRAVNLNTDLNPDPVTESLLVAAARREAFVGVIRPHLSKGEAVISERYTDAYFAYGAVRGLSLAFLNALSEYSCEHLEPRVTILLDLPASIAAARIAHMPRHRIEREDTPFHEQLRSAYLAVASRHPERVRVIDASLPGAAVLAASITAIEPYL